MQIIAKLLRKPLFEIPQGYDSGFGRIYAEYFGLNEDTSLFATALEAPTSLFPKEISRCFLGQEGNLDRRLMLAELRKEMVDNFSKNNVEININRDYQAGRSDA